MRSVSQRTNLPPILPLSTAMVVALADATEARAEQAQREAKARRRRRMEERLRPRVIGEAK